MKGSKKLEVDGKLGRIINEGDGKNNRKLTLLWDWRLDDQPVLKISGKTCRRHK